MLKEKFELYDQSNNTVDQIKQRITELVNKNKGNQALMDYIALNKELEDVRRYQEDKKLKDEFLILMNEEEIDFIEGNNFTMQKVNDYTRKDIDKNKLETEFPKVYNKCIVEKPVKGHVIIKKKLEG